MKKSLIILIFLIINLNNIYAENITKSWSTNIINLKIENKHYKKRVKKLDELLLKNIIKYKKLEDQSKINLKSLEKRNNKISDLNKKINSKKFNEDLVKEYINKKAVNFFNKIKTEEWWITFLIFYIVSSLILYLFFVLYTLPLRFIRFIWRKMTWYKEPSENNKDFSELIKKYDLLKVENKKSISKINNLKYDVIELKNINKTLFRNKNIQKTVITENKTKPKNVIFDFEEDKNKINTENDIFKEKREIEKEITKKESFLYKGKTDFFWRSKIKNKKFSLWDKTKLFE